MVENESVKKQKRKKRVRWITIVSAIAVVALILVAFLSTYVGNFTITVANDKAKLGLMTSPGSTSASSTTSYLRASGFGDSALYDVSSVNSNEAVTSLDQDIVSGEDNNRNQTFKSKFVYLYIYTFYVVNVGNDPCYYYYGMNITAEKAVENTSLISDYLRVRVYENLYNATGDQTHNYHDYTRQNKTQAEVTAAYTAKGLSVPADVTAYLTSCDTEVAAGTLTYFDTSSSIILSDQYATRLQPDQVLRYTLAMWLEGDDPDCPEYEDYNVKTALRLAFRVGSHTLDSQA